MRYEAVDRTSPLHPPPPHLFRLCPALLFIDGGADRLLLRAALLLGDSAALLLQHRLTGSRAHGLEQADNIERLSDITAISLVESLIVMK